MFDATSPQRKQTIVCFYNATDANNDGIVTKTELSVVINKALVRENSKCLVV